MEDFKDRLVAFRVELVDEIILNHELWNQLRARRVVTKKDKEEIEVRN